MANFARILGGLVAEQFDSLPTFTPELMATIVPCPGNVRQGWSYDGANFAAPPPPPDPPTNDQVYDAVVRDQQVVKAVVLAIIDGTLHTGMTPNQAKNVIKAHM